MLKDYAAHYFTVGYALSEAERKVFEWGLLNGAEPVIHSDSPIFKDIVRGVIAARFGALSLPLGTFPKEIERLRAEIAGSSSVLRERVVQDLNRISKRFRDELEDHRFLHIPSERLPYYGQKELFGPLVSAKFPKCLEDIESAGNCYAVGQPTACVLHLMRAMEGAVERLNRQLGLTISPRATWGTMLGNMDDVIKKMADASAAQKRKKNRWSEARANLYHVKEAWRNESMHPKQTYTSEQAREVLEAVRVFMTALAKL